MHDYPETVNKIVEDFLGRLKARLTPVPREEGEELLREISSHIYEAFQQGTESDEVLRILAVLERLGEPSEIVADRLPGAMLSSGRKRSLPLYLLAGFLLTLFGIPLGFAGVAVLTGMLVAIAAVVLALFATAGSLVFVGLVGMILGLLRMFEPELWDQLILMGLLRMDGRMAEVLGFMSPSSQGILLFVIFGVLAAAGLGMLWVGKHLIRGLRFLFALLLDRGRKLAVRVSRLCRQEAGSLSAFRRFSPRHG